MEAFSITARDLMGALQRLDLRPALRDAAEEIGKNLELTAEAEGVVLQTEITPAGEILLHTEKQSRARIHSIVDEFISEERHND